MDKQKALNQLRLMQAWHEDFGNGPNADYDAICYAIGVIEEMPEGTDTLIKALEQEHKKLLELQKALKNVPDTNVGDTISRQAAIDALDEIEAEVADGYGYQYAKWREYFVEMPSVQPERTCVNCGRTANNGGWYADGGTRCPIEEHYALPKDGYCHLWEKRNVTDDDYPEGRADE